MRDWQAKWTRDRRDRGSGGQARRRPFLRFAGGSAAALAVSH